jgi:hypothetical protein
VQDYPRKAVVAHVGTPPACCAGDEVVHLVWNGESERYTSNRCLAGIGSDERHRHDLAGSRALAGGTFSFSDTPPAFSGVCAFEDAGTSGVPFRLLGATTRVV